MEKAIKIVEQIMLRNDTFSKWMDVEITKITPGSCCLKVNIREEMLNGFQTCHGGVSYSIADSALAFASNFHRNFHFAYQSNTCRGHYYSRCH